MSSVQKRRLPGKKVVVGTGPKLKQFRQRYPRVTFTGYLPPDRFAYEVAGADVFVFPSLTDTFGLVMLEAMACGVPVAAYPVTGPIDVVRSGETGVLDKDLRRASIAALSIDRAACRRHALQFSWTDCAVKLLRTLVKR